jgi:hypothetical protein
MASPVKINDMKVKEVCFKLLDWLRVSGGKSKDMLIKERVRQPASQPRELPKTVEAISAEVDELRSKEIAAYLATFEDSKNQAPISIKINTDSDSGSDSGNSQSTAIAFLKLKRLALKGVVIRIGNEIIYLPSSLFCGFAATSADKKELLAILDEIKTVGKVSVSGSDQELVGFVQNWIKSNQDNEVLSISSYLNYHLDSPNQSRGPRIR